MKLGINGSVREVAENPDQTALSFLRREGMVGTKEGCASGDCGACTILVGREISGNISYQTRNACITPLNQLVHSHVVTVEGLADSGGLHPAQEAMLEKHASQCGFCTPGFVMAALALKEKQLSLIGKCMSEKIESTYVNVNKDRRLCDFTNNWLKK